jgi:isoamylase
LLEFVTKLIALRKKHPSFRRRTYPKPEDTSWLAPEGREMGEQDWKLPYARCFGMLMVGQRLAERDEHGNAMVDKDLLVLLNAHHEAIEFVLPGEGWRAVLDTADRETAPADKYSLQGRSLALLVRSERA